MSDEIDIYQGRIIHKDGYFAFEILNNEQWCELVIRGTEAELKQLAMDALLDENNQPVVDSNGKIKTATYPYYYKEI